MASISVSKCICIFVLVQRTFLFYAANKRSVQNRGVRHSLPGGTRVTSIFHKSLDSQLFSLRFGLCF